MDEGYLVNLTDEEGNSFNLEIVGEVEYEDENYVVFLPADMSEDDPDYGFIILRSVEEDGVESFDSVDDEELLEKIYALYLSKLEEDEAGENGEE